jgi:hypothetical protein
MGHPAATAAANAEGNRDIRTASGNAWPSLHVYTFSCISTGGVMTKVTTIGFLSIVSAFALLGVRCAQAQKAVDPPAAPIPTQVLTAKRVFISNGESANPLGLPNLAYNAFYAGIKAWGKYQLVSTPAEADVVFAVRFEGGPIPTLRLVISDPKTHVTLWPLLEEVREWLLKSTGRKNFDQAMTALVEDVKILTASPAAVTDAAVPTK